MFKKSNKFANILFFSIIYTYYYLIIIINMKKNYLYIFSILLLLFISFNSFATFATIIVPTTSIKTITTSTWSTTSWSILNIWTTTIKASTWALNINNQIKLNSNCESLGWNWPYPWNQDNDPYKDNKCCAWLTFVYPSACYEVNEQTGHKTLLPWCHTTCAKVWDWICDTKYENSLNSSDCDIHWCDLSKNYVCWVKTVKTCVLKDWCKNSLQYMTYDNECLLKYNTSSYVLYGNWKCEDLSKNAKELTSKVKLKLDSVIKRYITKLEINYNTKADKIDNINWIILKMWTLEIDNPLYINLTQYITSKLKIYKTKYQNEEDLNIDDILKIFN